MKKFNAILGFTTNYFEAHLCGGAGRGKFYLVKYRAWDKEGKEINVTNCCSILKDGTINWFSYPVASIVDKDGRGKEGERVMYMTLMVPELDRLSDLCLAELKYMYDVH